MIPTLDAGSYGMGRIRHVRINGRPPVAPELWVRIPLIALTHSRFK